MSYSLSDNLKALYEAIFNKLRYFTIEEPTETEISDSLIPFMETAIGDSANIVRASDLDNGSFIYRTTSGGNAVFVSRKLTSTYKIKASCDGNGDPEVFVEMLNNLTPARTLSSFERDDVGLYTMTFSGTIASSINLIDFHERDIIADGELMGHVRWNQSASTNTVIKFKVTDPAGNLTDNLLLETVIQIDVNV